MGSGKFATEPALIKGRRKAKELSALEVRRLTTPGLHFIGGVDGLILRVLASGSRQWILRVRIAGKRKDIGLGGFPDVTLEGARTAARALREQVRAGIDPVADRKKARAALKAEQANAITFKQAAERFIDSKAPEWRNDKHVAQWSATLARYAYPVIGEIQIRDVDIAHVIRIVDPIWTTKTETASRLRGRIEAVIDWATAANFRTGENPARWKGRLDKLLPAPNKTKKVKHHAALPWQEIAAFMPELREQCGMGARALEFAILTAARSGEVRGATWQEIDLNNAEWVIPAARMKAKKEHRVPLSPAAMKVLDTVPRLASDGYVFPGQKAGTQLSDMSLTATLRRMDRADLTAHGFRSTFRDWAGETTAYSRETIEHALAHQLKDKAEAAYARGSQFEKRRRLMDDWAKYCDTEVSITSVVVPIRA